MQTASTSLSSGDPVLCWLDGLYTQMGLNAVDRRRCIDEGSVVVDTIPMLCCVPMMPGCDLVFQVLAGEVGPANTSGPLFEAVLQMQTLLCGPAMPVFGFDAVSRQLLVMGHFAINIDTPAHAALVLRNLSAMAKQWREVLQNPEAALGAAGRDDLR